MVTGKKKKKSFSLEWLLSFPRRASGDSVGKEPDCNAVDTGSIPGSGISSGEGNDNPLQYSFLENPMDTGQREPGSSPWGPKSLTGLSDWITQESLDIILLGLWWEAYEKEKLEARGPEWEEPMTLWRFSLHSPWGMITSPSDCVPRFFVWFWYIRCHDTVTLTLDKRNIQHQGSDRIGEPRLVGWLWWGGQTLLMRQRRLINIRQGVWAPAKTAELVSQPTVKTQRPGSVLLIRQMKPGRQ